MTDTPAIHSRANSESGSTSANKVFSLNSLSKLKFNSAPLSPLNHDPIPRKLSIFAGTGRRPDNLRSSSDTTTTKPLKPQEYSLYLPSLFRDSSSSDKTTGHHKAQHSVSLFSNFKRSMSIVSDQSTTSSHSLLNDQGLRRKLLENRSKFRSKTFKYLQQILSPEDSSRYSPVEATTESYEANQASSRISSGKSSVSLQTSLRSKYTLPPIFPSKVSQDRSPSHWSPKANQSSLVCDKAYFENFVNDCFENQTRNQNINLFCSLLGDDVSDEKKHKIKRHFVQFKKDLLIEQLKLKMSTVRARPGLF